MWFGHKYCKLHALVEGGRFDAMIDHLALKYIIKSKVEQGTTRVKRVLEITELLPI